MGWQLPLGLPRLCVSHCRLGSKVRNPQGRCCPQGRRLTPPGPHRHHSQSPCWAPKLGLPAGGNEEVTQEFSDPWQTAKHAHPWQTAKHATGQAEDASGNTRLVRGRLQTFAMFSLQKWQFCVVWTLMMTPVCDFPLHAGKDQAWPLPCQATRLPRLPSDALRPCPSEASSPHHAHPPGVCSNVQAFPDQVLLPFYLL